MTNLQLQLLRETRNRLSIAVDRNDQEMISAWLTEFSIRYQYFGGTETELFARLKTDRSTYQAWLGGARLEEVKDKLSLFNTIVHEGSPVH